MGNSFELIWWQQGTQVKGSSQQGGLLNEQTGIDRIREALQAHTWPSMTMKHSKTLMDSASGMVKNKTGNESTNDTSSDLQSREIIGKTCMLHINKTIDYILTDKMLGKPPNEDENDDKFEELFDKFMAMKGKAVI